MDAPTTTPAAPAGNVHAELARGKKVLRLCMAIDGALGMWGVDPFSPAALEIVLAMNDAAWTEAQKHARVPPASEQTRGEVHDIYSKRVEVRVALRRIDGQDRARNRARGIQWCP